MKKTFTLFFLFILFASSQLFSQGITLLPSIGVQRTVSVLEGSSPVLSSSKQYLTNYSGSIRGYINNKKSRGVFLGLSSATSGISVEYSTPNQWGSMSSVADLPRLELGYYLLTKPVYINNLLNNSGANNNNGIYFQFQPLVGFGYNFGSNLIRSHSGSIGAGNTSLSNIYAGIGNFSLLTGANIYIGKNNKPLFFISAMRNSNFGNYSAGGLLTTQYGVNTYQQKIHSFGSGTTYSLGVPIRIGGKKKK